MNDDCVCDGVCLREWSVLKCRWICNMSSLNKDTVHSLTLYQRAPRRRRYLCLTSWLNIALSMPSPGAAKEQQSQDLTGSCPQPSAVAPVQHNSSQVTSSLNSETAKVQYSVFTYLHIRDKDKKVTPLNWHTMKHTLGKEQCSGVKKVYFSNGWG